MATQGHDPINVGNGKILPLSGNKQQGRRVLWLWLKKAMTL